MSAGAEALGNLFRDLGSSVTEKLRTSEIGSQILDTIGSQRNEFSRTPEGIRILDKMDAYTQQRNKYMTELMRPIGAIKDAVKNDPVKLKANIGTLHQHFQSTNHPAASHTTSLIQQDPANATKNLSTLTQQAYGQANLLAQGVIFGKDHAGLAADVMPLYDHPDPTMHSHADAMLNIVANQFHDTISFAGTTASRTKLDVKKYLSLIDKQRVQMGQKPLRVDLDKFDVKSVYEKHNMIENLAGARARIFLAPMIAINHISTFFNYANAPLSAIAKAMMRMDSQEVKQLYDASGIFGSQMHHMISEDIANRTGFIASKTGQPEIGAILGKTFHNPGFNFVRSLQLKAGAIIGYHSLIHWTEGAMQGDKRAMAELKEMGIDVNNLIRRGGQLSETDKAHAIFHFVNNRAFIDRNMDRSLNATKSPWTRLLTMFHGYVTSQQAFMRRELQKLLDSGDYGGIARYAGTVGLVFPAIAPMLKSAEVLARTASVQRAGQGIQDDYRKLTQPSNAAEFMSSYLDMLSYFGSWGTLHSFLQSSHSDRLALALMGPVAGDVVRTTQDLLNYVTKPGKSGKRNIRPLAEDVLQQTIPGLGNIASNQLFPPKKGGN